MAVKHGLNLLGELIGLFEIPSDLRDIVLINAGHSSDTLPRRRARPRTRGCQQALVLELEHGRGRKADTGGGRGRS